jgi:hypothetical protein
MTGQSIESPDVGGRSATRATRASGHRLRLLILMAQGTAGALPEAWQSYGEIEDARASALETLRNPHVVRVGIVEDNIPLRLVEWVG